MVELKITQKDLDAIRTIDKVNDWLKQAEAMSLLLDGIRDFIGDKYGFTDNQLEVLYGLFPGKITIIEEGG